MASHRGPLRVLLRQRWRLGCWLLGLLLYLLLAFHQLGLPGLHYDEAAEAGVNAMELLTGGQVTAFRQVTFTLFGRAWPLMVQDYIGALNVYLAWPLLALTGIGVPNLRLLSLLAGLAALILLERALSTYWQLIQPPSARRDDERRRGNPPISLAGLLAVWLLAISPSFVFWSRQGIFVTNLTEPLVFWSIWQGLQWWRTGHRLALIACAFAAGLALYAKLLAFWVLLPFALLLGLCWLWARRHAEPLVPALAIGDLLFAGCAFFVPLLPLLIFNWQSGGTLTRITDNVTQSYYGVNNLDLLHNGWVRGGQLWQVLRSEQFWYLGGSYANLLAPWLAVGLLAWAWLQYRQRILAPLVLLLLALSCSLFTVSDLFITHYALIQPVAIGVVALAAALCLAGLSVGSSRWRVLGIASLLGLWLLLDLANTLRYHTALARSGGLADHSDASYHLAYHLRYNGLGAPIALDWGFAASVRYLSEGTVQPIEIFGYENFSAPDDEFLARLQPFLANPDNVYLLHAAGATVFAGRREQFFAEATRLERELLLEQTFSQRDGTPLYELWRLVP